MPANHCYVFLGPQGSGKGTQADLLAAKLSIPHLSTGQLFRQAVVDATALGQQIAEQMATGHLISDAITNQLIAGWLQTPNAASGFILDGYPRNLNQAEFLSQATTLNRVVLLELSNEESVRRLSTRRHCVSCGRMYNVVSSPPRQENVCDACGGALAQRDDDTEDAIRERLRLYHQETEPLIAFYESAGLLARVDGSRPVPEVFAAISQRLGVGSTL